MADKLSRICEAIRGGREVDPSDLVPLLGAADIGERFRVNDQLARAYFHGARDLDRALVFAERAFLLSGLSEAYLAFYVELQSAAGAVEARRSAYKRMGMRYAAAGDVDSALRNFNLHRDAYALSGLGNRYAYDFDVLESIARLARAGRREPPAAKPYRGERIRLAYVVFHVHHPESVIVKMLGTFARHHDAAAFEAVFFVPESSHRNDAVARRNIGLLAAAGARVVQVDEPDAAKCLYETARRIQAFDPHILVTTAVLAEYAHQFIAQLVPAPVRIGLTYGPPELYIAPELDWVIATFSELLIDGPCNGSVVPVEYALPAPAPLALRSRESLGIPADAVVLLSAGRPMKFLCREFWEAVLGVLDRHANAVYLVLGIDEFPPFFPELASGSARRRVLKLGWQSDYLNVLGIADVVVDTFPSGGGIVNLDAAALSIPVVSYRHDYFRRYDQMDWSPGAELLPVDELLAPRGRFDRLQSVLSSLAEDPALRRKLGDQCRRIARKTRGSPARYVRRCESVYRKVLKQKLVKPSALGSALSVARRRVLSRTRRLLSR